MVGKNKIRKKIKHLAKEDFANIADNLQIASKHKDLKEHSTKMTYLTQKMGKIAKKFSQDIEMGTEFIPEWQGEPTYRVSLRETGLKMTMGYVDIRKDKVIAKAVPNGSEKTYKISELDKVLKDIREEYDIKYGISGEALEQEKEEIKKKRKIQKEGKFFHMQGLN